MGGTFEISIIHVVAVVWLAVGWSLLVCLVCISSDMKEKPGLRVVAGCMAWPVLLPVSVYVIIVNMRLSTARSLGKIEEYRKFREWRAAQKTTNSDETKGG